MSLCHTHLHAQRWRFSVLFRQANRQRPNCKMNNINRLFWMVFLFVWFVFFCRCRFDCHFDFFFFFNHSHFHLCAFWCNLESLNGNTVCTIFPLFSYQWSIYVYSITVFLHSNWHHSQMWMNRNFRKILHSITRTNILMSCKICPQRRK